MYGHLSIARPHARHLQKVLVVDPFQASSRMLADILKTMGAREVIESQTTTAALSAAGGHDPQMIFCEFRGAQLDGLAFVRSLRRSDLPCRMAPVIMVTGEATAQAIMGARNAGVHEFLRKPFAPKELSRRIEAVTMKGRDWVEGVHYVGPDRRRFNSAEFTGQRKRKADSTEVSGTEQALRILKSAVGVIDTDPRQALRAMQAQAAHLIGESDRAVAGHASGLQQRLAEAVASGQLDRAGITAAAAPLLAMLPADTAEAS